MDIQPNIPLLETFAEYKRIAKDAEAKIKELKPQVLAETKRILAASDDPDAKFIEREGLGKFSVMKKLKGYEYSVELQAEAESLSLRQAEEVANGDAKPQYGEEYVEFREIKV